MQTNDRLENMSTDASLTSPGRALRVYRAGRLVYYRQAADADFWDTCWNTKFASADFSAARQGRLDLTKKKAFLRYLPRNGRILEAGCGLGKIVMALRAHGYDVEGVEWGAETVALLNQHFPDLPVREGDVRALDVSDSIYAGYTSLGVIEHREAGPEPFLTEAFRVLQPGGVAFISVPQMNILRRMKARLSMYAHTPSTDLDFYQYAFSREEFTQIIEDAGFKVIDWLGYSALKGVRDEIPLIRWLAQNNIIYGVLDRVLSFFSLIEGYLGHMQMIVCVKPENPD